MTEVATPGTAAASHMAAGDARDSNREVHVRGGDEYVRFKKLQQQLEFLNTMEDYVVRARLWRGQQRLTGVQKDEQRNLRRELVRAQEEVKRIQSVPLVIGQFLEPIDQTTGIVGSTTGSNLSLIHI